MTATQRASASTLRALVAALRRRGVGATLVAVACCGIGCSAIDDFGQFHVGEGGPPVYRVAAGVGVSEVRLGFTVLARRNPGSSTTWRLVWSGDRTFAGTVTTRAGAHVTDVRPGCVDATCPILIGTVDPVTRAGDADRLRFRDATAPAAPAGFDVTVDEEPLYFDLSVNQLPRPDLVAFPAADRGGAVATVGAVPFGLTTR